jgi:hypothetical protein
VLSLNYVIDGGGATIGAGFKGGIEIDFNCSISQVSMYADQSGSIVVDIWVCSYANYAPPTHPAVGDTITGSDIPTITSAEKMQDTTLTGWTLALSAGSFVGFNVNSCTSITRCTVALKVSRS